MKLGIIVAAFAACASASQAQMPANWTAAAPAAPEPFAPGIVARPDTEESMLTVSADGSEIFWGVSEQWFPMSRISEVWTARRVGGGWTGAKRADFSVGFSDGDPFVSADGSVYFVSMRPAPAPRKDFDLYVVERGPDGYAAPRNLGPAVNSPDDELYPSVAADGTLYFGSERSGLWQIYRARRNADGSYAAAEALPAPVNLEGVWSFNPFISSDGSTLLFTSLGRSGGAGKGDIWMATRGPSGEFGAVRNLGPVVNTAEEEFHPTLSPDGKALFFVRRGTTNADIYWVSAAAAGLVPEAE